ncbi:MAG TPA: hypothetical protein VJY62_16430 [Bacteroidia bacterium]|nr:hypothetical protein [Bacteroidia bacterium]
MFLAILIINLLIWLTSSRLILSKKNIFNQAGLLKLVVSFFLSFSLISMLFILSVYWYIDFRFFLLFLSLVSLLFYFKFNLKQVKFKIDFFNKPSYRLLAVLLSLLAISLFFIDNAYKWGGWDSFAIWSMHAKFLTYKNYWSNYFTDVLDWSHPDYPLMLSSYISIIWKGAGAINGVVPSIIAYITLIAVPLSAYSFLTSQNLKLSGLVFLIIMALDNKFIEISSWLNADTLLALFFLLTFILYYHSKDGNGNKNILFLLGFFAASCGWIKNEGLLFYFVFSVCFLLLNFKNPKDILRYICGSVIPLLMIVSLKFIYATENDIMKGQNENTFEKVMDFNRYEVIFKYFAGELFSHYKIILIFFALTLIFNRNYFKSFSFVVLMIMLSGYFAIYVITPQELKSHLATSCERLFHQLYPSLMFTMLFVPGKNFNTFSFGKL